MERQITVRDPERYGELRLQGYSKGRAARVAAAVAPPRWQGRSYEHWSKRQLYEEAKHKQLPGRSSMSKGQLIRALRAL